MVATPVVFFLAIFVFIFLFWRSLRHELIESDTAFDLVVIGSGGAFIFGRIFEFVLQSERFAWDFSKPIFFNVYPGFDFYGALFGAGLFSFVYLKRTKIDFWQVWDLVAAPLVLGMGVWALGNFNKIGIIYLVIFWVLKRLEKRKRHVGFFAAFYLVSVSAADVVLFYLRDSWALVPAAFLTFGIVSWYILARRNARQDMRAILAQALLIILAVKRMIKDTNEVGTLARTIILSPFKLWHLIWLAVKLVVGEIIFSLRDLLYVIGVRKSSRY